MAEADLGRIVSLIMENPELVEKIRSLGQGSDAPEGEPSEAKTSEVAPEPPPEYSEISERPTRRGNRRSDLLCALKPYVSKSRRDAIEAMLGVFEIIDLMGRRGEGV